MMTRRTCGVLVLIVLLLAGAAQTSSGGKPASTNTDTNRGRTAPSPIIDAQLSEAKTLQVRYWHLADIRERLIHRH